MQKEEIIERLRKRGCRITKQRDLLIDLILEGDFYCYKEIYYKAALIDETIGVATVYRMVHMLEEIGVIRRNTLYQVRVPQYMPE